MADSPIGEPLPAGTSNPDKPASTDHPTIGHRSNRKSKASRPGGPTSEDVDEVIGNEVVAVALEQLSDAHRAVLRETFLHRHTVTEAAGRLGVPPGTVKARAHFALRALRNALAELGAQGLDGTA